MGVEYNQPAHLLDRYIKGGDINGGRLYLTLARLGNKHGSQFCLHHLSTWACMCILSMTISMDASFFVVEVRSAREG